MIKVALVVAEIHLFSLGMPVSEQRPKKKLGAIKVKRLIRLILHFLAFRETSGSIHDASFIFLLFSFTYFCS